MRSVAKKRGCKDKTTEARTSCLSHILHYDSFFPKVMYCCSNKWPLFVSEKKNLHGVKDSINGCCLTERILCTQCVHKGIW